MKRLLQLLGYRCTFYSNPQIALDAFRKNPDQFDAVISDMTMPLLSGLEVAKELHAIRPGLPIALTSGRYSEGIDQLPIEIKAWICKPTTIKELGDLLEGLWQDVPERAREAS
jgi:CheY-like chemotaxis protein